MIPALLVVVLAFTSSLLLLSAFVIYFSDLINSLTLSLLITGASLALVAYSIYKISLSPTLKKLRDEYEQAIEVIILIRQCYRLISDRIASIISLFKQ